MSNCVGTDSILGVEVADHLFLFMFLLFLPRLFVKNTKIKKNAVGKDLPKLYCDDFLRRVMRSGRAGNAMDSIPTASCLLE